MQLVRQDCVHAIIFVTTTLVGCRGQTWLQQATCKQIDEDDNWQG